MRKSAHESRSKGGKTWDVVRANVDNNGSWFQPFALDEVCLADGRYDDISFLDLKAN